MAIDSNDYYRIINLKCYKLYVYKDYQIFHTRNNNLKCEDILVKVAYRHQIFLILDVMTYFHLTI